MEIRSGAELTTQAIVLAARQHFSHRPYDQVSIEAVAADARFDPALVMRHYGSKERLFAAAVEADLGLPDLSAVAEAGRGQALAQHMVGLWEERAGNYTLAVLLRSVSHEPAGSWLRDRFTLRIVPEEHADRRAGLISSHLLVAVARYLLALPDIGVRDAGRLIVDIAPALQRYLSAPLPSAEGARLLGSPRYPPTG